MRGTHRISTQVSYALDEHGRLARPSGTLGQPGTYRCLECGEGLYLKAEHSQKVRAHFAHFPRSLHAEGHDPETILHLAAKRQLVELLQAGTTLQALVPCTKSGCREAVSAGLTVPAHTEVREETTLEGSRYHPDVGVLHQDRHVMVFEARHTHRVDEDKAAHLNTAVPWVEFTAARLVEESILEVLNSGNLSSHLPPDLCCERCTRLTRSELGLADEVVTLWGQVRSLGGTAGRISALTGKQIDEALGSTAARLEFFTAGQKASPLQVLRLDDLDTVKVLSGLPESEMTTPLLRLNPSSRKPELIVTRRQLTLLWWTRHKRAKIGHRLDPEPRRNGDWERQLSPVDVKALAENGWASLLSHQLAAEAIERYVERQPKRTQGALGDEGKPPEQIHLQWMGRTRWMMYRLLTLGIAELLRQTPRPAYVKVNQNLRYAGRWDRTKTAACNHLVGAGLLEKDERYSNVWLLNTGPLQVPGIVALLGLDARTAAPAPAAEAPAAAAPQVQPLLKFS